MFDRSMQLSPSELQTPLRPSTSFIILLLYSNKKKTGYKFYIRHQVHVNYMSFILNILFLVSGLGFLT